MKIINVGFLFVAKIWPELPQMEYLESSLKDSNFQRFESLKGIIVARTPDSI